MIARPTSTLALLAGMTLATAPALATDTTAEGAATGGYTSTAGQVERQAFHLLDDNGDNELSRMEANDQPGLMDKMESLDRDGDGTLSRDEYQEFELE